MILFKNFSGFWYNLFRPREVLIFISFPLAGYLLINKKILPIELLFSIFLIVSGIIIDNTVEGYKRSKEDSLNGDYPVIITLKRFLALKILRIIFYSTGAFFTFIFSKSSFPWIFISVFLSIIYNNHKISVQKYAPLDSLLHFLGGIVFTISGGVWEGGNVFDVLPFAISMGLIFTGGYFNHLLIDRERDERTRKFTLAHILSFKKIRSLSLIFIAAGDILMGYFLSLSKIFFIYIFIIGAIIIFYSGIKIKDPRKFRNIYRLLHLFFALFIILKF